MLQYKTVAGRDLLSCLRSILQCRISCEYLPSLAAANRSVCISVNRARVLQVAHKLWKTKDLCSAMEYVLDTSDQSILTDLLSVLNLRPSIWNLDLLTLVLPSVSLLIQSKHES